MFPFNRHPFGTFGLIGNFGTVPLKGVEVEVSVRGFVAHTSALLSYHNTNTSQTLDVLFRCPVLATTAVYSLVATIDGIRIVANTMEKNQAEQVYSEAIKSGHTAVLAKEESNTEDIITIALGNMAPGSMASIELFMVGNITVASDGGVCYTLPTVLNPRYTPPHHSALDPLPTIGSYNVCCVTFPYTLKFRGTVTGSHPISRITCNTHPMQFVLSEKDTFAQLTPLNAGPSNDRDFNFVIYYHNPYTPHVLIEAGDPTDTGIMRDQVAMINVFPELPADSYSNKNEVIFIVDRSGSMAGANMRSARDVLLLLLKSLPLGCYFNVISFGNTYKMLFQNGSNLYTAETLSQALRLQETMYADMGGTEILAPLRQVYRTPPIEGYSRQILLLTDGQVFNVAELTSLAARFSGVTRVFAVGVGNAASTALVEGLATAGGGRSEMVATADGLQSKVMGLVHSMLQCNVRNVTVTCNIEGGQSIKLVTPAPPIIFGGQHLTTYARIPPGTQLLSVTVSGTVEDTNCSTQATQLTTVHDAKLSLHRLASREIIRHNQLFETENCKHETVELSIKSGVLSKYTAMVAVNHDGKKLFNPIYLDRVHHYNSPQPPGFSFGGKQSGGLFGSQLQPSGFAGSQPQSTGFAGSQPQSTGFAGSQPQSTGFSSSQPQPTGFSFGSKPQSSSGGFGSQYQSSHGLFGSQPQSTGFGGSQLQPSGGLFGSQPQSTGFGGGQPQSTGFGGSQPQSTGFGGSQPQSTGFGGSQTQSTGFGGSQPQSTGGLFGNQPQQGNATFCSQPQGVVSSIDCSSGANSSQLSLDSVDNAVSNKNEDMFMTIVKQQEFDGSWKIENVAHLLGFSKEKILPLNVQGWSLAVFGTIFVIALLRTHFPDRKLEWALLVSKAKNFLQQNVPAVGFTNIEIEIKKMNEALEKFRE